MDNFIMYGQTDNTWTYSSRLTSHKKRDNRVPLDHNFVIYVKFFRKRTWMSKGSNYKFTENTKDRKNMLNDTTGTHSEKSVT